MMGRGEVGLAVVLAAGCTTGNPVFMLESDAGSATGAAAASTTDTSGMSGMSSMSSTTDMTDASTGLVSSSGDATGTTGGDDTTSGSTGPELLCGNGVIDDGETCDDKNVKGGDNCEANCLALFAEPKHFDFSPGFYWDLEAGDLNNDGHLDLVAARHDDPAGAPVLFNQGDGTFAPGGMFPLPGVPFSLHAVALAGDNGDDLVVGALEGHDVFVKHQAGGGDFDGALAYVNVMTGFSAGVQLAHVDDDPWIDMVVPVPPDSKVAVARGKADGFFESPVYYPVGAPAYAFTLARLDQGTGIDFIGVYNDAFVSYFVISRDFYPGPANKTIVYEDLSGSFSSVVVADLGAPDGTPELAFTDAETDRVRVFQQTPGQPVEVVTVAVETSPNEIAAVALRGDGSPDLITRNGLSGSVSVIATLDGFQASDPIESFPGGLPAAGMAIADFDGDGFPDLAVLAVDGQVAVHINQTGE